MTRYFLMLGLLIAAVVVPTRGASVLGSGGSVQAGSGSAGADSVAEAVRKGRDRRVERILGAAPSDEALGPYLGRLTTADPDRGTAQIRRGLELGETGATQRALATLDSARTELPWFEDWIQLFAAEVAASAGDTAEVRRRLAASEPELVAERGWRLRMDAAREAGDNQAARQAALDAARSARSADRRAIAWSVLGDLRAEGGDTARAREAYRSAMEAAPASTGAVDAARGLSRLGPTVEEWRTIGTIYNRHGNHPRAIDGFERWLAAGVGQPGDRARVRLQLGKAYFDAGRYREAEQGLLALARDSVADRFASEALYLAARAQYRQGRSADGQATFVALSERFPDQDATARGLYLLADLKHDDLELAEARSYYRRAVDAAPALNEAGLALMRLGGLAFLDGDHEQAARIYEEYRTAHPNGRRSAQATYWAARAYAHLGRDDDASRLLRELRDADPVSYYGVRASELLQADVLDIPLEPSPAADHAADSLVASGVRRVDLLEELERRDDVVVEVERLRRHFEGRDGGDYALAEALNERGYTLTGVNMGWEIRRREGAWNPRLLRIIYPFPFREKVFAAARERGLDPYLVAGLIRRESAFSPVVVSSAGAIGLMQIMPETGRGLAQGAGLRRYTPELLKEPHTNIDLGVRYLDQLMRRFGQDNLPTVLSAYNAGPNRAVRWRDLPEHGDPELFTERIPYAETRDYVRHVLFHRAVYRALYPDAAPAAAASTDR